MRFRIRGREYLIRSSYGLQDPGVRVQLRKGDNSVSLRLQHHGSALMGGNVFGEFDQPVGRNASGFGVSTGRQTGIGHTVTRRKFGNFRAGLFNHAGTFQAGYCRQRI